MFYQVFFFQVRIDRPSDKIDYRDVFSYYPALFNHPIRNYKFIQDFKLISTFEQVECKIVLQLILAYPVSKFKYQVESCLGSK